MCPENDSEGMSRVSDYSADYRSFHGYIASSVKELRHRLSVFIFRKDILYELSTCI